MVHKQMIVSVVIDMLAHDEAQYEKIAKEAATTMRQILSDDETLNLPRGVNVSDIYVGVPQVASHSGIGPLHNYGQEWQGQQGQSGQFGWCLARGLRRAALLCVTSLSTKKRRRKKREVLGLCV